MEQIKAIPEQPQVDARLPVPLRFILSLLGLSTIAYLLPQLGWGYHMPEPFLWLAIIITAIYSVVMPQLKYRPKILALIPITLFILWIPLLQRSAEPIAEKYYKWVIEREAPPYPHAELAEVRYNHGVSDNHSSLIYVYRTDNVDQELGNVESYYREAFNKKASSKYRAPSSAYVSVTRDKSVNDQILVTLSQLD